MEYKVFPSPAVAGVLNRNYIETRLHTDGEKNRERILELQQELAGSYATPSYVLLDPETGEKKGVFMGLTDEDAFAEFLSNVL